MRRENRGEGGSATVPIDSAVFVSTCWWSWHSINTFTKHHKHTDLCIFPFPLFLIKKKKKSEDENYHAYTRACVATLGCSCWCLCRSNIQP